MVGTAMKRPPIYEVEWVDSMGYTGWENRERRQANLDEPRVMVHWTIGYLFKRTRAYVAVAQSVQEQGEQVGDVMQIPRGAVLSMKLVRD